MPGAPEKLLVAAEQGRTAGAQQATEDQRLHSNTASQFARVGVVCARRARSALVSLTLCRVVQYSVFGGGRARVLSGLLCCWPGTDASGQRPRKIRPTGKAMPGKKGPSAQIASREVRDARFRHHASAR